MTVTRILCPTDFSEASAHAVDQATVIAGYYKARITAMHVLNPIAPSIEEIGLDRLCEETATFCEAVTKAGIPLTVLIEVGPPVSHILGRAIALPADLIVMGTHGSSGFEHLVLGSVTEKVLRKAACPVLTVPPRAHATSQLPFKRLLCAVDFSDSSLSAVRYAISVSQQSSAALTLLHVLEWPWEEPPRPSIDELPVEQGGALAEFRRYCETSATRRLESMVPGTLPALRVTTRLMSGKPYVQILEVAAAERSDLIIVGVRGRDPLDLTLFGSTTNQVVRRATCPVLTLRQ
jgi:nucleotide-binding universal stress UspA family protein